MSSHFASTLCSRMGRPHSFAQKHALARRVLTLLLKWRERPLILAEKHDPLWSVLTFCCEIELSHEASSQEKNREKTREDQQENNKQEEERRTPPIQFPKTNYPTRPIWPEAESVWYYFETCVFLRIGSKLLLMLPRKISLYWG